MHRLPTSHKGDNGKVAIIGGSKFQHGAPIMSALAAEASGVDLVYLALPNIHQQVARHASLNFQVHPFNDDDLREEDIEPLLELLATIDCAVIGPGLARDEKTLKVLRGLIDASSCALVLDATALQPWTTTILKGKNAVLTPHLGELERMGIDLDDLAQAAKESGAVIHLKGPTDRIASPDGSIKEVSGGNAGLTVGGTGDALAGLIAGLIAQHMEAAEACAMASTIIKRAGTVLAEKRRFAYTTKQVIDMIPHLLSTL